MANNIDASLINTILSQAAITKLAGKYAVLGAFTADYSDELRDVRSRSILVPYVSGGSAVQVNPTDFQVGDTDVMSRNVLLNHISKTAYLNPYDIQNGRRLEWLAQQSINTVATELEKRVFQLITEANFGAAVATYPTGSMAVSSVQTLWGALPGSVKNFCAAASEFKNFVESDLFKFKVSTGSQAAFGYDSFDWSNVGFTNAGAGITSFAAAPQAIVCAAALPAYTDAVNRLLDQTSFTIPDLGISIQSNIWADSQSRNTYHSFDVLFGCALGDTTAMKLGKSV